MNIRVTNSVTTSVKNAERKRSFPVFSNFSHNQLGFVGITVLENEERTWLHVYALRSRDKWTLPSNGSPSTQIESFKGYFTHSHKFFTQAFFFLAESVQLC